VRGQGGDATEEEGDGPKTRTRSQPGLQCNEFPLSSYGGDWAEASSAGYGWEAVKMPVFLPWPQSGRAQYEETTNGDDHNHHYRYTLPIALNFSSKSLGIKITTIQKKPA
jgi:hypothetical protein